MCKITKDQVHEFKDKIRELVRSGCLSREEITLFVEFEKLKQLTRIADILEDKK